MPVTRFETLLSPPARRRPKLWRRRALRGAERAAPLHDRSAEPGQRTYHGRGLAPRTDGGQVAFAADRRCSCPSSASGRAGVSCLDVVNRGNTVAVPNFNQARCVQCSAPASIRIRPSTSATASSCGAAGWWPRGWQADVPELAGLFGSTLPEARSADGALTGRVYTELQAPGDVPHFLLSDRNHLAYPAADLEEAAILVVRDQPDGPVTTIPASGGGSRGSWRATRA